MKFGANTQIWVAPFSQEDLPLIDKVAALGFEMIELGYASAEPPFNVADVKSRLKIRGPDARRLQLPFAPSTISPARTPRRASAASPTCRRSSPPLAELGGEILSGPLYAELFRARYLPADERAREWEWSVASLREIAKSASTHGVTVALEPLNRFETDFVNQSEAGGAPC